MINPAPCAIIEDDANIAENLYDYLNGLGHSADPAHAHPGCRDQHIITIC